MSEVRGGEGGRERDSGQHRTCTKKGIHRRQVNEVDTTCAWMVWGHEANTKSWITEFVGGEGRNRGMREGKAGR